MRHLFTLGFLFSLFSLGVVAAPSANGCLNGGGNQGNHHAAYCQALLNQHNNNNPQPVVIQTPAPTPAGYPIPPDPPAQRTPAPPVVAVPTPRPNLIPVPMPVPKVNYAVKVNTKLKRLNKKHVDRLKSKKLIHKDGSLTKAGLKKGIHQIVNQSPANLVLPHVLIAPPLPKPPLTPPDPIVKVPTPDYSKMGVPLPKINPGDKIVYYTNVKGTIQSFGAKDLDKIKLQGFINPDGGISGIGVANGLNFMVFPAPDVVKAPPIPTPQLTPNVSVQAVPTPIYQANLIPSMKKLEPTIEPIGKVIDGKIYKLTELQINKLIEASLVHPDGALKLAALDYGFQFIPTKEEVAYNFDELDQVIFDESIKLVKKGIPAPVYSRVHEYLFTKLMPEASESEFSQALGEKGNGTCCWWCWILVLVAITISYYTYKKYSRKEEGVE